MASIVSAGTTSGTALNMSGDTSGVLQLASNNGTTAVTIDTSQNVGVGTSSPDSSNKLQVTGDIGLTWATDKFIGMKFGAGTSYKMGLVLKDSTRECKVWSQSSDSDDKITFYTGPTPSERMRIDSSGKVTVGSTAQTKGNINIYNAANTQTNLYLFKNTQVEAYFGFLGSTDSNLYVNTGGTMGSTGVYMGNGGTSWTSNSDERLKENLVPITDGLNKVSSLRSVIGNFIADENKTAKPFLIAQDVQSVLPEAVSEGAEIGGIKYLGVSYTDVIPLLVASIKELKAINDTQAETLTQQTEAINALTARVVALESRGTV